jgi:hypothetical protein
VRCASGRSPRGRGDIDDGRALCGAERRQGGATDVHRPAQVHIHHTLPVLRRRRREVAHKIDAGHIHHAVQPRHRLDAAGDGCGNAGRIRHVAGQGQRAGQVFGQPFDGRAVAIHQGNPGAPGVKQPGDGLANARSGA